MISRQLIVAGLRYLVVGGASLAVYIGFSAGLHRGLPVEPLVANAAGYGLATVFNYLANFYWAFETSRSHASASWRFMAVVLLGLGINSIYAALMLRFTALPIELIGISFVVLWPIVSFVALRFWALR